MQIRRKLTYQFIVIVALILIFSSFAIYFFSADYREDDFYNRLLNKATITAKLLIEVEEVDVNLLRRIDKDNPVSLPNEKISIYNFKNEELYSSDDNNTLKVNDELLDQIRLNGEIRFVQENHEVIGFLFADKYDRFVVVAGAVDIYGLKKLKNLRIVLVSVFGIGVIFVLLAGWIYAGRALKPISKVIDQVDNITVNSLNLRVDEGNNQDEIDKLAATFNSMLDRMESAFKMQKNFIANASHELRTPLTAITGQLEVTLMNERNKTEYQQVISSVLEDMKSVINNSNRLLLLAQANSDVAMSDFIPVRIDDMIWQSRNELIKRYANYQIHVSLEEKLDDERKLTVSGNEQLIKTAILNLMENGCKYSPKNQVMVYLVPARGYIMLEFTDEGIGIEDADIRNIFEPFYRGKNALTFRGSGIGLSLVNRIVLLHGGKMKVQSNVGQGSKFTILLPYLSI